MAKYGIDNVRGGAFSQFDIESSKDAIRKLIASKYDTCFKCGGDHFAKNCPVKNSTGVCARCGFSDHTIDSCRSEKDIYGKALSKNYCHKCGRNNHTTDRCFAKQGRFH